VALGCVSIESHILAFGSEYWEVGPISGQGYGCAGMPDFYAAQRSGTKISAL